MSVVDEWARNRAWDVIEGIEEVYRGEWQKVENVDERREYYAQGLTDLAALLLSDEPVEAAARVLFEESQELDQDNSWDDALPDDWRGVWLYQAREVLTAALTKITEDN